MATREDRDVQFINAFEGATFEERYATALEQNPALTKLSIASKFNENVNIKRNKRQRQFVDAYYGATPEKKYNAARLDNPKLGDFSDLYPKDKVLPFKIDLPNKPLNNGQLKQDVDLDFSYGNNIKNVDTATTVSVLPERKLTPEDKLKQFNQIKNMENAPTMTRDQLETAGIDENVIEELETQEVILPPNTGEVFLDPLTIAFENKILEPVMKVFGKMAKPLIKEWKQFGIPRKIRVALENNDIEALKRYKGTIEELKGLKLGDEVFTNGKSLGSNIFSQRDFKEKTLDAINAKIDKRAKEIIPYDKRLAQDAQDIVGAQKDIAYKGTQDAYDAVEDVASELTYPIKQMKEDILNELKERGVPPEVYSEVKRNLEYIGRNLTPVQDVAKRQLTGVTTQLENLGPKLASANSTVVKGEKAKKTLVAKMKELKKGAKGQTLEEQEVTHKAYSAMEKELATLVKGNSEAVAAAKKLKAQQSKLKTKAEGLQAQLPDTDYVSEKEYMRMIKRFNEKTRLGGNLSTKDRQVTSALQLAKKRTQESFEAATKEHNPAVYNKFMDAQKKFKEYVEVYGRKEDVGGMLERTPEEVLESIISSPEKVLRFGKQLMETDPALAKRFSEAWLSKKFGAFKQSTTGGLFDGKQIDYGSMANKITEIMDDPAQREFIKQTMGEAKLQELDTLFNLAKSMEGVTQKLSGSSKLDEGFWDYVKDADGKLNATGRALRYVVDGIRGLARDIGKSDSTLAELVKKNDGKIFKSLMQNATPAVKNMLAKPYNSNWLTGYGENKTKRIEQGLDLINDKLSGRISPAKEVWETQMGSVTNEAADEVGAYDEGAKATYSALLTAGMTPAMIMKTAGIAKGGIGYTLLMQAVKESKAKREVPKYSNPVLEGIRNFFN